MLGIQKSFEELDLTPDASYEEAKATYRELASILHPDKHMHNERLRVRATEKFQRLQSAWCQLEAYYKSDNQERIRPEEHERQARDMAEAALRAEAERRRAERRKTEKEISIIRHRCPSCGAVNDVAEEKLGGRSIEDFNCGVCSKPLNKQRAREQHLADQAWDRKEQASKVKMKRENKQIIASVVICIFIWVTMILTMNSWGVVIAFFTSPFVATCVYFGYCIIDGHFNGWP